MGGANGSEPDDNGSEPGDWFEAASEEDDAAETLAANETWEARTLWLQRDAASVNEPDLVDETSAELETELIGRRAGANGVRGLATILLPLGLLADWQAEHERDMYSAPLPHDSAVQRVAGNSITTGTAGAVARDVLVGRAVAFLSLTPHTPQAAAGTDARASLGLTPSRRPLAAPDATL